MQSLVMFFLIFGTKVEHLKKSREMGRLLGQNRCGVLPIISSNTLV